MHRKITLGFVQLIVMLMYAAADEPVYGCSQLHSLEHLLEKQVRIEFKLEQLEKKHGNAEELNGQESGSYDQERRLDDLSQKMDLLEKNLKGQNGSYDQKRRLDDLSQKMDLLEKSLKGQENSYDQQRRLDNLSQKMDLLEKSLKEQRQAGVQVAFTALLMEAVVTVNRGDNMVFNKVQTNIGNAYNPSSGNFVAPINGTYYFHTSFLSVQDSELWVSICLNSAELAMANARGHNGRHGTGSQSVIFKLKSGDIVSVKMHGGTKIWGALYSTFSGFLIH